MITAKIDRLYKHTHPTLFIFLARLLALVLLVVGSMEYVPALVFNDPMESIHLWHMSELAALAAILLGGALFMLSFHPWERPVLAQFFLLSAVLLVVGIFPFDYKMALGLSVVAILFVVLYPARHALLSFTREGKPSLLLLGLTALFAVFLLPTAWRDLHFQIIGMTIDDPHAQQLHWIGSAVLIVLLLMAGMLTATKRPGWKILGVLTGEAYCYLGLLAMIVPDYPGSWGVGGGFCTAVGGGFYILLTLAIAQAQPQSAVEAEKPGESASNDEQPTNTIPRQHMVSKTPATRSLGEIEENQLAGTK